MTVFNLVTEVLIYALVLICVMHAWRGGGGWIPTFAGASLFGFILEYTAVRSHSDYYYSRFLIMLPPGSCSGVESLPCRDSVPLWITLGWGVVLYLVMQTSSRLELPWAARPALDALLAVNVDWILDPLAARLSWWTWIHPGPWFGIPLDNYFGWIVTVAAFSFLLRWLRRLPLMRAHARLRDVLPPFLAMAVGPVVVFVAMKLYLAFTRAGAPEWLLVAVTAATMYAIVLYFAFRVRGTLKPDLVIVSMALFFQLYYSGALWLTGVYRIHPWLIVVSLITIVIAALGYSWPYRWRDGAEDTQ
jgi:hypothetical protein